jgi:hypothetical protein
MAGNALALGPLAVIPAARPPWRSIRTRHVSTGYLDEPEFDSDAEDAASRLDDGEPAESPPGESGGGFF